jgi:hypothetical protein
VIGCTRGNTSRTAAEDLVAKYFSRLITRTSNSYKNLSVIEFSRNR